MSMLKLLDHITPFFWCFLNIEAIDGICEGLLGEELVYVAEEREAEARTWKPEP